MVICNKDCFRDADHTCSIKLNTIYYFWGHQLPLSNIFKLSIDKGISAEFEPVPFSTVDRFSFHVQPSCRLVEFDKSNFRLRFLPRKFLRNKRQRPTSSWHRSSCCKCLLPFKEWRKWFLSSSFFEEKNVSQKMIIFHPCSSLVVSHGAVTKHRMKKPKNSWCRALLPRARLLSQLF